jgi:hypothetical protein
MHLRATTTNRGVKMRNAVVVFAALASLSLSSAAFAQTGPGNSTPGLDRYLANPGRQQATDVGAQCGSGAGSGAFGFFGKDNNLGIKSDPTDPGADGHQTGINNSSVCGNRQGNLP